MIVKQIILTLAAALAVFLFFRIPRYEQWLANEIFYDGGSIGEQYKHLGIEERMKTRFGRPYLFYKNVAAQLENKPIILLPPNKYIHAIQGNTVNDMANPEIFYYFTGIRSVTAASANVALARYAIVVDKRNTMLVEIVARKYIDSLVDLYKPYLD